MDPSGGRGRQHAVAVVNPHWLLHGTAPYLTAMRATCLPVDDTHEQAVDRGQFFLSVDDDLAPFYTIGREDPHVLPIQKRLRGSHQVKFLTPFKNACWADLLCHASRYGSHQGYWMHYVKAHGAIMISARLLLAL